MSNEKFLGILAIIGPILTFIGAKRLSSGTVNTTDAATLWKEAEAIRLALRDEVIRLTNELKATREKLEQAEQEKVISHKTIRELLEEMRKLEKQLKEVTKTKELRAGDTNG